MFEYSSSEWATFTRIEKKIIVIVLQYKIEDHEKIRSLIGWPLEPLGEETYRSHWKNIRRKMKKIRLGRIPLPIGEGFELTASNAATTHQQESH